MRRDLSISKIERSCSEVCLVLKSLSHPLRLLILGHLIKGSKSVGELVELCGASQSQISQFLIRMKFEGLVRAKKDGKFQVYSVNDKRLVRLIKTIHDDYCKD